MAAGLGREVVSHAWTAARGRNRRSPHQGATASLLLLISFDSEAILMSMPYEGVPLFLWPGRRFGDQWRFVRRAVLGSPLGAG